METWDLYDAARNKMNKTMTRGNTLAPGEYHMVIHVCIFNSNGEMLIQQRQPFKEGWPNMWDVTVGGSAVSGDTSQMAAERETLEEIGLELNLENVRPTMTMNFARGFDDIYLIEMDVDIKELSLQYEEVQSVKWAAKEEILEMIEAGTFIPYEQNLIRLYFDLINRQGAIKN
ncbi:NUDIX domain-containing protein [Salinicoccus hispanicus]|uniref:NUDIX domain-containing protein n=1 Tax=Salinicoccus hispanicus TaxID=157225 RepID=A0A6N8U129_9STAP|nr:NUDIX domain-containing protein [Salinicoccus hispanicus]MXQ51918.1 NUDIX domain-containing protein [Salinicoccus hispanicus]